MKRTLILTLAAALLQIAPCAQASPEKTKQAQIVVMCKSKDVRLMLPHELTCTLERKLETVKKLQEDPELREVWDHNFDRS